MQPGRTCSEPLIEVIAQDFSNIRSRHCPKLYDAGGPAEFIQQFLVTKLDWLKLRNSDSSWHKKRRQFSFLIKATRLVLDAKLVRRSPIL